MRYRVYEVNGDGVKGSGKVQRNEVKRNGLVVRSVVRRVGVKGGNDIIYIPLVLYLSLLYKPINSSNRQIVKLSNCQIIKSSNGQIVKSSNRQIFKSSNHQIVKSSNLQIIKSSNSQIVKSSKNIQLYTIIYNYIPPFNHKIIYLTQIIIFQQNIT